MAQRPDLSRYLDAGADFVALTRSQARARAKELVGQGQLAQEQMQGFVDDLVEESRRRTDEMLDVVRREIQRQVKTLGIATKDDLARLESRIAGASKVARPKPVTPKPLKKPATAAKPAKKATKRSTTKKKASVTKKPAGTAKPVKQGRAGATRAKRSPGSGT